MCMQLTKDATRIKKRKNKNFAQKNNSGTHRDTWLLNIMVWHCGKIIALFMVYQRLPFAATLLWTKDHDSPLNALKGRSFHYKEDIRFCLLFFFFLLSFLSKGWQLKKKKKLSDFLGRKGERTCCDSRQFN